MSANIIIDVRNSEEKEISTINMSVQLDASFRHDVMSERADIKPADAPLELQL